MRKPETIAFWVGRLPHWEVTEGRYFVTLHVAGAIPEVGKNWIRELSAQLHRLERTNDSERLRLQRHIFSQMEHWLDTAQRNCHLQHKAVAEMVMEAVDFRSRNGVWRMFEYVVMPNHLHLFFELISGRLKKTLEDFKEWTGKRATKILRLEASRFWQREWFDHWSRSDEEDEKIVRYIRNNPVKAGLVEVFERWPFGSWSV